MDDFLKMSLVFLFLLLYIIVLIFYKIFLKNINKYRNERDFLKIAKMNNK